MLLIPISALIILSIYIGYDRYQTYTQYTKLDKLLTLSIKINDLVHELQKERGFSSVVIGSKGKNLKDKLSNQRILTNKKLKNFEDLIINFDATNYGLEFYNLFKSSLNNINQLNLKRKAIDNLTMQGKDSIAYYSNTNGSLIEVVRLIADFSPQVDITKQLNSHTNFLLAKERAGIERAVGAYIFALDIIIIEWVDKFNQLIFEQNAYIYSFEKLSSKETFYYYKQTVQGRAVEEVKKMRNNLSIIDEKQKLLPQIAQIVGYGGIIHHFKNYLIRGEEKYKLKVFELQKQLLTLIKKYNELGVNTKEEEILLNTIKDTFNKYYKKINTLSQEIKNGLMIKELDKKIRINDDPAIEAIYRLNKSSFFSHSADYWIEQITLKINLLQDVNTYIINNIIKDANKLKKEALNGIIFYSIFSIFTLLVFLKMSQLIMKDIINAVTVKEEELQSIAKKLKKDVQSKTNELILLNKNLETKVEEGVLGLRKKDELLSQQAKLAAMGEMMGAIAHQWRQPLNTLSVNIQFLDDDFEDNLINKEFIKEFIKNNMNSINFMSNTIDDFRNFFRVDKEKINFEINECINKPINILTPQLKSNNIHIETKGDSFILYGLASEYQQVILNIINNAKDILLSNEIKDAAIIVNTYKDDEFGYVSIEDNAGGIPEDVIDRIFEPYFTTKEQGKGTGIGLYMSKMIIVDNMHGEISVSNTNLGAKFVIKMKLAEKPS